jgi:hypothetical protein
MKRALGIRLELIAQRQPLCPLPAKDAKPASSKLSFPQDVTFATARAFPHQIKSVPVVDLSMERKNPPANTARLDVSTGRAALSYNVLQEADQMCSR